MKKLALLDNTQVEPIYLSLGKADLPYLLGGKASPTARRAKLLLDAGSECVILKGFPLDEFPSERERDAAFCAITSLIGKPMDHGSGMGATIWSVTPRASLQHTPTFSETAAEAPLHTDNSWVSAPEKYFSLLVVNPATDGGHSILFSVSKLLREFLRADRGAEAIFVLQNSLFPFAMPAVFRNGGSVHQRPDEVVLSPVITDGASTLRYRYDAIQAGFAIRPDLATKSSVWALDYFNSYLTDLLATTAGTKMERGDLLLVNNHSVLHARTAFSDPARLLLRIRMSELGAPEQVSQSAKSRSPARNDQPSISQPGYASARYGATLALSTQANRMEPR